MVIFVFRVIIIYLIVLLFLRIMGKRQLGELQPFELVITLLIADIATLPMTQTSMPILFSLVPLLTLVIMHFLVSLLARKNTRLRKLINGKPVIVVSPNGIQFQALKDLNMSLDDLMEGIRCCNYFNIDDILYAIVETNGSLNVIPKIDSANPTNKDLKLSLPENSLPMMLISCGKLLSDNLNVANLKKETILNILNNQNIKSIKEVLILTINPNGQIYLQTFNGDTKKFQINFKGEW